MTKARTVLISGASIAGPALAFWLRHYGFAPTVVERGAPALREGGYKVDLRGVAIDVAEKMGILDDVRGLETDMRTMSFVNAANKRTATIPADLFMGRGEADVEVMRGDLSRLLYDATKDDVEYLFGDSITSLTEGPDGVQVSFEHGAPRTFDLVVGADGLHSKVRSLAFGDEKQFMRDLGYTVSIYTVPNHLKLDREELVYSIPGRTVNTYSTGLDNDAKALFLFHAPAEPVDRRDTAGQRKLIADTFGDAGWETSRLLGEMDSAPDFYFDSVSQVEMDSLSRGRVTVVGDAGYCPSFASGQGTSLALVGAYVLAGELAAAGGDHVAGFAAYERAMRDFVAKNQKLGRDSIGRMVAKNRFQTWIGAKMMKALPKLPWKNALIKAITGPIHDAATAITLKTYA